MKEWRIKKLKYVEKHLAQLAEKFVRDIIPDLVHTEHDFYSDESRRRWKVFCGKIGLGWREKDSIPHKEDEEIGVIRRKLADKVGEFAAILLKKGYNSPLSK